MSEYAFGYSNLRWLGIAVRRIAFRMMESPEALPSVAEGWRRHPSLQHRNRIYLLERRNTPSAIPTYGGWSSIEGRRLESPEALPSVAEGWRRHPSL